MAQNAPPPYTNITGISRAVMKDNAQETIEGYNGSARPGELVVDLEVDPPTVFIGNNSGALTQISTGNGAADYGDANVAVFLAAFGSNSIVTTGNVVTTRVQNGGNIEIRSNVAGTPRTWTFDAIGDLNLPVGGNISGSGYVTAVRVITDPRPLANLAPVAGGRAFVSDGNLVATGNFGALIGGGGANTVPVYSDGVNWFVG
jgi:hypothetical protein